MPSLRFFRAAAALAILVCFANAHLAPTLHSHNDGLPHLFKLNAPPHAAEVDGKPFAHPTQAPPPFPALSPKGGKSSLNLKQSSGSSFVRGNSRPVTGGFTASLLASDRARAFDSALQQQQDRARGRHLAEELSESSSWPEGDNQQPEFAVSSDSVGQTEAALFETREQGRERPGLFPGKPLTGPLGGTAPLTEDTTGSAEQVLPTHFGIFGARGGDALGTGAGSEEIQNGHEGAHRQLSPVRSYDGTYVQPRSEHELQHGRLWYKRSGSSKGKLWRAHTHELPAEVMPTRHDGHRRAHRDSSHSASGSRGGSKSQH